MRTDACLPRSFYDRDVTDVARDLIGRLLYRRSRAGLTVGRIIETEAYLAEGDPASHSFRGRNRKNASMFGAPGRGYVYTIHARQCFNVVTEKQGRASAVLVRSVEPLTGLPLMRRRRNMQADRDLCRGPARLCEAFDIGRKFDGFDLTAGRRLWIAESDERRPNVLATIRIGVTSAAELPLRFIAAESA